MLVLVGAGLAWAAEPPPAPANDEPVRVYTNADLEPLTALANGVLTVEGEPKAQSDAEAWRFVGEFLDREARRLDAERAHELELRRAAQDEIREDHGYYPLSTYGYGYGYGYDAWRHDGSRRHGRGHRRDGFAFGEPIRPIHAGPTKTQIMWSKAKHLSGVDAFPSNRRGNHARGHRHSR